MSEKPPVYPKHLYDLSRLEIASTILQKEHRKLYLGLGEDAWTAIDESIIGWYEHPTSYHLEDGGPRDFWDSFAALLEGVKLKPNFTAWITAENVRWNKVIIPVRNIQMTSPLAQLRKVPGLNLRNNLPFAELMDILAKNNEVLTEQKTLIDQHSTDPAQDKYPIIVRRGEDGLFKVMDGNRRTLRALIYGHKDIEAWAGELDGAVPINFWVPVNDMLQLVKLYKEAVDSEDSELQKATALVLKAHFRNNVVAVKVYETRIANQTDIARRLFNLTQQMS